MTYSEMKNNRKALERENTSVKFEKPMTYSEMKPISNIMNGKDTLFNDIMSFGKSAMGDNPFSGYYKQGYKSPDDYNAASNYLLSSIDSLKGFKDRLNKNRAAYERVYGADTVKKQEESLDQMLSLYNSQDLWDDIEGRRDAFAQYKDADEYDTLNDMTADREKILDEKIAEAQRVYDEAKNKKSVVNTSYYGSMKKEQTEEEQAATQAAKSELERLKQLKVDWEDTRKQYDDEGTPFSEKYNGYDYKGIGLAINALASKEYALSDSQKRELKWLRDNQISFANDKELENALALAKGQAENARTESDRLHRVESDNRAIGSPEDSSDAYEHDPYKKAQKSAANETAAKYEAQAATLQNYYDKRKENERLAAIEQKVHEKYMPLLNDEEFAKHTSVENDKKSSVYFGSDRTTDVYNNIANIYNVKMTDDERKVFYGLYNTDKEKATEYLNELEPVLNKRATDAWVKIAQEGAEENPVLNSLFAIAANLVSGIGSVDALLRKATGKDIDTNSPANILAHYSSSVRGTTSQMLSDYLRKNPDSFWNTKSALFGRDKDGNPRAFGLFAKETTESMIDNLARIAVSKGVGMAVGGNAGISEAALKTIDFTLMGSQVATQTIIDAKKRGLSDGKALAMGFTSGAIEAITEVWSIEKVLGNPKSFVKTLGKSLLAEGSEEISSNILNRAVDVLINSDQSEVMQEYYGYINEGLSPSEASAKTLTGIIGDDLSAGLGGALSGVMMSGTNYRLSQAVEQSRNIRNGIRQIKVGRELKSADSVMTALDEIIKANPNNTEAIEAKAAIEKGEKVSARRLGKLFSDEFSTQYNKTVTPVDSAEVKAKLEHIGVKNADKLSKTIAKAFNEGQDSVKGQERTELTHNAEAMKIYNEYLTERENAAKNSDRLFRTYSNVDRSELISYAKEQGKNNSFIREASDLAEGKTDLDSLDNLQEAVFTEITDKFLSADTVEEAQNVYKELSQGAGKGIKSLLDTALDNRTEEITAANSYDKIADVSFKKTRDGVAAYIVTEKMAEEAKAAKSAGKKTEAVPISLFDANIGTETTAVIDRATAKPAEARTIYAKEYVDGNRYLAAASYDRAFNKYYEAGKKGMSFSDIKRSSRDIKADSARRIYEAGRRVTENESKRQSKYKQSTEYKNRSKERTEQNAAAKKQGGVVREYSASKKVSRQQRQQLRLLDVWAQEKGVVIRVVDSLADKIKLEGKVINGRYDGGNVITIALDGRNMLTSTAGHELYHMIQRLSPEYAKSFSEFVINHLKEAGKYDSVFRDYERRYGKTYARDENFKAKIDEEIVADHCFEALTNKEQWESFAAENKTIADKIKDFIKEFVAMINRAFDKYFVHDNAEIRNEVIGEVDYMNEIARRFSEGVDEAVENYRFGAGTEGETKYSQSDIDKTSGDNIKYTQGGESNGKLGQTISDEVQGSTVRAGNTEHTFSVDQKEKGRRKITVSGRTAEVLSSSEETAEQKRIRQQLKAEEEQDVYFTTDGTYLVTDSAVFMPADIFEDDGFTLSDRQASFSEDRFNYLVSTYSVKNGGAGSQNYSKGYVAYISPSDFLALTTTNEQYIVEDARNKYHKLDVDFLKNERQTPFLIIDLQTGEVTGHEGRHRMALLRDAGIEKVAIVIEADSEAGKYNTQKLNNVNISGQEFRSGKASGTAVLEEVIPLSPKYRNEVKEKFVDVGSDIKYSVSDSNGNQLSENQQKYFADSKVRDENGNLLVVRHGTNNEFNIFDFTKAGKNGAQEGYGFYFSDDPEITEKYGSIQKECYLNITKPLYNNQVTVNKTEIKKLADALINFDIEKYADEGLTWQDSFISNYVDTYSMSRAAAVREFVDQLFSANDNDSDLVYEMAVADGRSYDPMLVKEFYDVLTDSIGYDGIIAEWKHKDGTSNVYVTFNSEQAKLTDNQNPTDNPDVRYSVSDIDNYTEEMYDNFGWVKVNDVLSSQALSRMYSQFASINTGVYFDKTPEGYYIIPTGDYNKASNCLVYISGTMEMPVIQKIIKLNLDNETNIYIARMVLDGFERNRSEQSDRARKTCGNLFSDKEIITEYNRKDFESYQELKARTRQSMHASQRNNRAVRDGGRNTSEDSNGSEVVLSDDQRASISDAGMRLTDDTELSSLMRENAYYKSEIERLKGEFVKSKRMGGKGKNRLMQADINRIARSIIGEYSSEISFYDLKDELTGFYEFLANADVESSGDYAFIVKTANDIAKSVIAQSFTDITPEEFADYKKALRGYRLIPNLEDVAELEQMFGTFGAAYRQYGKKLNMRAQGTPGALHIDEVWEELCEAVPLLDRNADSTQEMWRNLIEVRDSLDENTGFNPYLDGGEFSAGQTAAVLGTDILERFNEISPDTTFADRAQQRVDLREQKISELKAEKQEALSKLRNQRDARISELKESFREQNRKNRERRNGTDTKNKIRRVVKKLRSLYLHPTKERNIKKELRPMIEKTLTASEFLFAKQKSDYEILMGVSLSDVGNNTKAAESLVKLNETYLAFSETNAEISRIKAQIEASDGQNLSELEDRTEQLTKQRDKQQALLKRIAAENGLSELAASRREQLNRETVGKALSELYDAYKLIKNSRSQYIQGVYSETVENRIEIAKNELGKKTVPEMSNAELEQLYDVYKMLYSAVTGANKIFASGKKATVEEMSLKVMEEIERAGKNDSLISGKEPEERSSAGQKAVEGKRGIEWEMLQPFTAFYKTGSETFRELYNQALEGQDKWARNVAEFKAFATGKRRQHGIWSIDESEVTEYTLESGERIKLTVPELMSIYALSRRDQGRKHLLVGGITLAENEIKTGEKVLGVIDKRYGRDTARAYHLTEGDLSFLAERLDGNLRKYVEEMQEYLSTVVAEKGNEVARVLYGIDIFGEANYFPISSDRRFLFSSNKAVDAVSLKNIGMTKNTVPNAANPVVIASFDKVWDDHTAKMALYNSMVLPIENMNRVLNFTSYLSEADSSAYSRSVRTVLEENFGKSAAKYFEQFVVDLNGGISGAKGGFWLQFVSKMKKTAVAGSLSVVVQQPTAIIRAFALINPKYFAGFKTQKEIAGSTRYEEIKRWAPIAIVKEIGGFDTGSGRAASEYIGAKEYSGVKNKVKGFFTDSYYRDEKFMVGAAKADELGWGIIWDAVKREIRDTTNLEFNSEEFLEACGKRFTDVIVQTQVYDSTLSRSSIMRNKSDIAKMATSFMGEPMTSFNMLYRAALDVNRSKGKAVGTASRAVAAVIGSIIAGVLAKSLISAGRDDDDDESYIDKYFQAVGGGLVDELNPLNLIPFARDLVTIIQGYDIDRADMTLFKDLWDAITKLDSDKISDYRKVENVVGSIGNIFGLPVRNIMRDVRTAYNSAVSAFRPSSRSVGEALTEGITGKEITDLDRYEALYGKEDLQGTKDLIKQMIEKEREKLLTSGEDQYAVNSKGQNKVNATARANIRNKFSNRYRDEYKTAYKSKDTVTVAKIKTLLSLTGLYDDLDKTLEEWRKAADEEVKKEKRAKEYAEKNK